MAELSAFVESLGEPKYRAKQLFQGIHERRLPTFAEMTDLPKELRAKLTEQAVVSTLRLE